MMENLDKTIERGTKIEVTKMKADSLVATSVSYSKRARQVRIQQKRKRIMIALVGIGIVIVSVPFGSLISDNSCLVNNSVHPNQPLRYHLLKLQIFRLTESHII